MSSVLRCMSIIALLLICGLAAYGNPVVGTEVRVCPTYNPAPGNHDGVEIAAGSDGYFAVWQDSRGGEADIFGCRISSAGQVMDPAGISICQSAFEQLDPAIAWNGREYLVVWADRRLGGQHIFCTRVRPDGEVVDPQGVCISGTSGSQACPRVASDGTGWQVVWQDSRGGSQDIYGCRVVGDGSVGRVMGVVTIAGNNEELPDIAYNGTTYVVVWQDQRNAELTGSDIYGCRLAKTGLRMGSDILVSCDTTGTNGRAGIQQWPRIASCGTNGNCMVVWEDYASTTGNGDIYSTRISSGGVVLSKPAVPIATGTAAQEMPGIGFDGTRMLVVWRDRTYRFVRGARVSVAGVVQDSSGIPISLNTAGSAGMSVCRASGSGFWVGWSTLSMAGNDALAAKVPGSGSFSGAAGTYLSLGLDDQTTYCVADNGSEYALVWSQSVSGKSCIMGARVSHSGALLTPTAVNLTATIAGQQTQPSIAWNGSEYLLVWSGDETYSASGLDIRGVRLDRNLQVKDANPILVCTVEQDQVTPYVCSNGSTFLVAWVDSRNAPNTSNYFTDLYGAVVDANGNVNPIGSGISVSYGNQMNPHVASNGSDYYVVWEDYRAGSTPYAYGVKVSSAGVVASATGTKMPATSSSQSAANVCYGGGNYLVTWSDGTRIAGCRVTAAGAVVDTSGISIDAGSANKGRPAAWWDGSAYQVVWEDYRSQFAGNSDVYYTTVASSGVVSSDPRTALVSDLVAQLKPAIFGNSSSGVLFYSRYQNYAHGVCALPLTQQGVQEIPLISAAKQMPAGTLVLLRGKVVTAVFTGYFYAEEPDRSTGIKVVSGVTVHVGDVVDVTGVIGTCDGERQITTGTVTAIGAAGSPIPPFGMRGDALGGVAMGAVPGITAALGANNIGLLVRTWGKVTLLGSGYFKIECSPGIAVVVKSGSILQPAVGKMVAVTGVSTCEVSNGSINRAILPRQQSDIQVLN